MIGVTKKENPLIASTTKKKRICKSKKKVDGCQTSEFGCCYDKKTPAKGPFSAGKIENVLFKNAYRHFKPVLTIFQVVPMCIPAKTQNITAVRMVYLLRLDLKMKVVLLQCAILHCMAVVPIRTVFHKEMTSRDVRLK